MDTDPTVEMWGILVAWSGNSSWFVSERKRFIVAMLNPRLFASICGSNCIVSG